jgi:hypothetical protein
MYEPLLSVGAIMLWCGIAIIAALILIVVCGWHSR